MDIFILTNSPGELSAWVKPVIPNILQKRADARIFVVVPPCPYSSGEEARVAQDIPGVYKVINGEEWKTITFLHPFPQVALKTSGKGIVVHMGGDIVNSAIFAKRLRMPAVAYTHRVSRWHGPYQEYMVADERTKAYILKRNIPPEKVTVVGDLMVDSVQVTRSREEIKNQYDISPSAFTICLLPGSRPHEVKHMAPFLLQVAELVKSERDDVRFLLMLSPFVLLEELATAVDSTEVEKHRHIIAGMSGKVNIGSKGPEIVTEKGTIIQVIQEDHHNVMNACDLALTSPGTKTAELAILGVPMVVITPLNRPEVIPIDGIWNFVGKLPFVGKPLKKKLVLKVASQMEFTALPNIKAEDGIVPELTGILKPEDVAISAASLIADEGSRVKMSERLRKIMGPGGAARKVADIILERAEE